MLARSHRLTKKKEIEAVLKQGRVFYTKYFIIRSQQNQQDTVRFAIIVSTKVSKKATQRNTIKRRLSELLRQSANKLKPGYDLVIIASPAIIEEGRVIKSSEIKKTLDFAMQKINLKTN